MLGAHNEQTSNIVHAGTLPGKTLVGTARSLGLCISDQWKQRKTHHKAYR